MFALHYAQKKISEIGTKSDGKAAIIGRATERVDNGFVLEDDSGKVEVTFDGEVELNKLIRVFCSVTEGQLKADIVQSLNNFDVNLFNKVTELYNKAGV